MSYSIPPGSTNRSVEILLLQSSGGTSPGDNATGLTASDLTAYYQRDTGGLVSITLTDLSAADDAHTDGGVFEVLDGVYRLDLPDAALAGGATITRAYLSATDTVQAGPVEIPLGLTVTNTVSANIEKITGSASAAFGLSAASDYYDGFNLWPVVASVDGDLGGKVLGGGSGTISGVGARADNRDGEDIASPGDSMTASNMRGTDGAYTGTPPTASSIADAVWSRTTRTLSSFGSLIGDVWSYATRGLTETVTTDSASREASKADVSSLATNQDIADLTTLINALNNYDGSDTPGTGTLLARLTATRAAYLDAEISSRSSHSADDAGTIAATKITSDHGPGSYNTSGLATSTQAQAIKSQTDKIGRLTEDDAGTPRFTANALENAPTGSGGNDSAFGLSVSFQTAGVATLTTVQLDASASDADDFYNGAGIVFTGAGLRPTARRVIDYVGASRQVVLSQALPLAPAAGEPVTILGRIE